MITEKNLPNQELTQNHMEKVAGGKGSGKSREVDPEKAAVLNKIRSAKAAGMSCDDYINSLGFPQPLSERDSAQISFIRYWWNNA